MVSVDPGAVSGWALFHDGQLLISGIQRIDRDGPVVCNMAHVLVIEVPQVYPGQRAKVDPNDLVRLGIRAGVWIGWYRGNGSRIVEVKPAAWKGQVPKDVMGRRILAHLSEEERANLGRVAPSQVHNMIDAVGIGLHHVGRLEKRT